MIGKRIRQVIPVLVVVLQGVAPGWIGAADPPDLIHYQGVLRDSADQPLDGDHDMTFRFYNASAGGVEILVDEHRASGTGAVTASGGLFGVELGGGAVSDGGGPGTYTSLGQVFADYSGVWMEITIDAGTPEVLSPRVHVVASAYAMNARDAMRLGGTAPSGYLDTSSSPQTKNGRLTITELEVTENSVRFGNAAGLVGTESDFRIFPGGSSTDDLLLDAGVNSSHGRISLYGGGSIDIEPGNGMTRFLRASDDYVTGQIDSSGEMTIKGDLEIGSDNGLDNDVITFDGAETLAWSNPEYRFELTDDLALDGGLQVGSTTSAQTGYNRFGTIAPTASGDITNVNDVMVSSDLEVGDVVYVGKSLVVGDPTPTTNQGFTSFGEADTVGSNLMNNSQDVFIEGDLEVAGRITGWYWFHLTAEASMHSVIDNDESGTTDEFRWYAGTEQISDQIAELQQDGDLRIGGAITQYASFDVAEMFVADESLAPGDLVSVSNRGSESVRKSLGVDDGTVLGVVSTSPGVVLGDAPFHQGALGEVWGEAIREEFLAVKSRLRADILESTPELTRELQEIETLENEPAISTLEGSGIGPGEPDIESRRTRIEDDIEGLALERFFEQRFVPVALAGRVPVKVDGSYGAIAPGDALAPGPIPGVAMKADGSGPVIGIALEPYQGGLGKVLMFVQRGGTVGSGGGSGVDELAETIDQRTPDPATGIQTMPSDLQVVLDRDADDSARFSVFRDGEQRGALDAEVFRVDEAGNVFAQGAFRPRSMDVAEYFSLSEPVEPGDVLVADRDAPGLFEKSRIASDRAVVGVVASDPGVLLGGDVSRIAAASPELAEQLDLARSVGDRAEEAVLWDLMLRRFHEIHAAVALVGTVPVKVDAGYGGIEVGDLLVASPTPGHAMRSDDPAPGTVIGKALEPITGGTGMIRALVSAPVR